MNDAATISESMMGDLIISYQCKATIGNSSFFDGIEKSSCEVL